MCALRKTRLSYSWQARCGKRAFYFWYFQCRVGEVGTRSYDGSGVNFPLIGKVHRSSEPQGLTPWQAQHVCLLTVSQEQLKTTQPMPTKLVILSHHPGSSPAACRGRAATRSHPNPGTTQSGHGRCQWSSGTRFHSRRSLTHRWPARHSHHCYYHSPMQGRDGQLG